MKGKLTKARYKAPKKSSCKMCKPWKSNGEDKKCFNDLRQAIKHDQELRGDLE